MLKSTRREDPAPYPTRPSLQVIENPENAVLREANPKRQPRKCGSPWGKIVLGFLHSWNTRSTWLTSILASSLVIVYARKHFSYQLISQITFSWMRNCATCIPRSCDCKVYMCHVQPPLLVLYYSLTFLSISHFCQEQLSFCGKTCMVEFPAMPYILLWIKFSSAKSIQFL